MQQVRTERLTIYSHPVVRLSITVEKWAWSDVKCLHHLQLRGWRNLLMTVWDSSSIDAHSLYTQFLLKGLINSRSRPLMITEMHLLDQQVELFAASCRCPINRNNINIPFHLCWPVLQKAQGKKKKDCRPESVAHSQMSPVSDNVQTQKWSRQAKVGTAGVRQVLKEQQRARKHPHYDGSLFLNFSLLINGHK